MINIIKILLIDSKTTTQIAVNTNKIAKLVVGYNG